MGCNFVKGEKELIPLQVIHGVEYRAGFPARFFTVLIDSDKVPDTGWYSKIYDYKKIKRIDKTTQLFKDDYNFTILTIDDKKIDSFKQFVRFLSLRDDKKEYILITKQQCFIILSTEYPVKIINLKEPVKVKRE